AITVFAGQRSPMAYDQVRGLLKKLPERLNAVCGFEVEGDAGVDAALPEMAVKRAFIAEVLHQLAQIAKIASKFFGRNRRVLPTFMIIRQARHLRRCAEAFFS